MKRVYFSTLQGGQKFRLENDPNSIIFVRREPESVDDFTYFMVNHPHLHMYLFKDRLVWIN